MDYPKEFSPLARTNIEAARMRAKVAFREAHPSPLNPLIERSNLSHRMGCRRFTRLMNAFSRKWENHWAAVTLWYAYYIFGGFTSRVTPAMEAGIADHVWSIDELLA